jgi:osmoprotectant transport system permease protein
LGEGVKSKGVKGEGVNGEGWTSRWAAGFGFDPSRLYAFTLHTLILLACALSAHAQTSNIGSKRFTESYILGEILKQTVETAGETKAQHRQGLGNTGIVYEALKSGAIDLYPEYTGTIEKEILKSETPLTLEQMNAQLAPLGLAAGIPLGFNNTYALAMREAQARELNIATLSDLARHAQTPQLKFGLTQEFIGRKDGWPGLKARYALPIETPQGLDHGLAYEAIAAGQIDLMDIYSTDAKIERYKLRVLDDDLAYFPKYDAVIFYRIGWVKQYPMSMHALQTLAGRIDAQRMIALNARAELDNMAFADVAREFISANAARKSDPAQPTSGKTQTNASAAPSAPQSFAALLFGADFWRLTRQHLWLVFASLAAAALAGIALGVAAAKSRALAQPILAFSGLLQTIPALALLAFLIPLLKQIGTLPALVALFLYALLPIVRNTHAGLTSIAPGLRESALALGLSARARLRLIELPLAAPTILAGVKTAAVISVGTATIAAFIGAGGYGERIVAGLALNDHRMLLAGAIPSAVLALIVQGVFELAERWFVPKGLRNP